MRSLKKCKVCGDKTSTIFNIDFKPVHICEKCAALIFLQQAQWYVSVTNQDKQNNQNK